MSSRSRIEGGKTIEDVVNTQFTLIGTRIFRLGNDNIATRLDLPCLATAPHTRSFSYRFHGRYEIQYISSRFGKL